MGDASTDPATTTSGQTERRLLVLLPAAAFAFFLFELFGLEPNGRPFAVVGGVLGAASTLILNHLAAKRGPRKGSAAGYAAVALAGAALSIFVQASGSLVAHATLLGFACGFLAIYLVIMVRRVRAAGA